jgi:hypothetical protein
VFRHEEDECSRRLVLCLHCGNKVPAKSLSLPPTALPPSLSLRCPISYASSPKCLTRAQSTFSLSHQQVVSADMELHRAPAAHAAAAFTLSTSTSTSTSTSSRASTSLPPLCAALETRCPQGCGSLMRRDAIECHVADECPKRYVTCGLCGDGTVWADEVRTTTYV